MPADYWHNTSDLHTKHNKETSKYDITMIVNVILGLFGNLGMGEFALIALVVLLLFGGKKIPELMKGLGKGVRSFKDGLNDVTDEISKVDEEEKEKK